VLALLDGIDALHRSALERLGDALGPDALEALRARDPAIAWLLDAYSIGLDERAAAESALAEVRPYIESHGGRVEVLSAQAGVVRVRMSGACAGCTASATTLRYGIEQALHDALPGFVQLDVEIDDAPAHPPPGATLLPLASDRDVAPG
jgi:Fe-S cluster biogenesis protein NfuA